MLSVGPGEKIQGKIPRLCCVFPQSRIQVFHRVLGSMDASMYRQGQDELSLPTDSLRKPLMSTSQTSTGFEVKAAHYLDCISVSSTPLEEAVCDRLNGAL